jgi:leader peptidase (prepilin peptidase)/N-methyltransferase
MTVFLPLAMLGGFGALVGACGRRLLGVLARPVVLNRPWCELLTAAAWLATGLRVLAPAATPGSTAPALALAAAGVPLALADLARQRLPNALTAAGWLLLAFAVAIAAGEAPVPGIVARAGVGALGLGGFYLLTWLAFPSAVGAGDVKLAACLGAALGSVGWFALPLGAFLAAMGSILHAAVSRTRRAAVPHGPAMLLAGWAITAAAGVVGGAT